MSKLSRRHLLAGSLALAGAGPVRGVLARSPDRWDSVVVGAGVFGAWTAWELRRRGQDVLLVDAVGPAHARASSGGESRMTRSLYGSDLVYTRMALESLDDWRWLSARSGLPVLHPTGVLMFFPRQEPFATQSIEAHRQLGLPLEILDQPELRRRFPQVQWNGIEFGLFEPEFGALMARRAVQTLVAEFVAAGGTYLTADVAPPACAGRIDALRTRAGDVLRAENYVFACGPWLPALLPAVVGTKIFPTRQEVFFFATPTGDDRFGAQKLPGWADFNGGDIYYGFPDLESRGFKIAHDRHGSRFDPDTGDRQITAAGLAGIRAYLDRRFPQLAGQPLVESRVCQYENSSNGDFLIDRLPDCDNAVLVGAGSGHGFKHGPAVGRYAADLVGGELRGIEPRFSLASKGSIQDRQVH
jgi:monomeric sarcosine oxidase